jgi:HAD superfamily phosphoserine phosphatase-like hydrolase
MIGQRHGWSRRRDGRSGHYFRQKTVLSCQRIDEIVPTRLTAYRRWCETAAAAFADRGLTRTDLARIAAPLHLTHHAREALGTLRAAGVVTAIISGGLDTFLEDAFPDYRDFVDVVFINRLRFDAGRLVGVEVTPYDFEGKAQGLRRICAEAGVTPEQAAFIGDRDNDHMVMATAGIALGYGENLPPMPHAQATFEADDLRLVLPYLLSGSSAD